MKPDPDGDTDQNNEKILYICEVCSKGFKTKKEFIVHERVHTNERPFQCDECFKAFKQRGALRDHLVTHSGVRRHTCKICDGKFSTSSSLRRHIKKVHGQEKSFACCLCNAYYLNKAAYMKHKDVHFLKIMNAPTSEIYELSKQAMGYKCSICNKVLKKKSSLYIHLDVHSGKLYRCPQCGENFTFLALKTHINRHHQLQSCQLCDEKFHDRKKYNLHLNAHFRVNSDTCNYCGETYPKDLLAKHMKEAHIQPGGELYQCKACVKVFGHAEYLKKHLTFAHIKCKTCEKYFDHVALSKHYIDAHLNKPKMKCKLCKAAFKTKSHLVFHMNEIHQIIGKFPCRICGKKFERYKNLYEHKLKSGHIIAVRIKSRGRKKKESQNNKHQSKSYPNYMELTTKNLKPINCKLCEVDSGSVSTFMGETLLLEHLLSFHLKPEQLLQDDKNRVKTVLEASSNTPLPAKLSHSEKIDDTNNNSVSSASLPPKDSKFSSDPLIPPEGMIDSASSVKNVLYPESQNTVHKISPAVTSGNEILNSNANNLIMSTSKVESNISLLFVTTSPLTITSSATLSEENFGISNNHLSPKSQSNNAEVTNDELPPMYANNLNKDLGNNSTVQVSNTENVDRECVESMSATYQPVLENTENNLQFSEIINDTVDAVSSEAAECTKEHSSENQHDKSVCLIDIELKSPKEELASFSHQQNSKSDSLFTLQNGVQNFHDNPDFGEIFSQGDTRSSSPPKCLTVENTESDFDFLSMNYKASNSDLMYNLYYDSKNDFLSPKSVSQDNENTSYPSNNDQKFVPQVSPHFESVQLAHQSYSSKNSSEVSPNKFTDEGTTAFNNPVYFNSFSNSCAEDWSFLEADSKDNAELDSSLKITPEDLSFLQNSNDLTSLSSPSRYLSNDVTDSRNPNSCSELLLDNSVSPNNTDFSKINSSLIKITDNCKDNSMSADVLSRETVVFAQENLSPSLSNTDKSDVVPVPSKIEVQGNVNNDLLLNISTSKAEDSFGTLKSPTVLGDKINILDNKLLELNSFETPFDSLPKIKPCKSTRHFSMLESSTLGASPNTEILLDSNGDSKSSVSLEDAKNSTSSSIELDESKTNDSKEDLNKSHLSLVPPIGKTDPDSSGVLQIVMNEIKKVSKLKSEEVRTENKPGANWICPLCSKKYVVCANLAQHIIREHCYDTHCKLCQQSFKSKRNLYRHKIAMHSQYTCSKCMEVFPSRQILLEHKRSHYDPSHMAANSQTYVCKVCTRTFATNSSLTRHSKKHQAEDNIEYVQV